ncbi:unnamed protein product, partial [Musa textilis]
RGVVVRALKKLKGPEGKAFLQPTNTIRPPTFASYQPALLPLPGSTNSTIPSLFPF